MLVKPLFFRTFHPVLHVTTNDFSQKLTDFYGMPVKQLLFQTFCLILLKNQWDFTKIDRLLRDTCKTTTSHTFHIFYIKTNDFSQKLTDFYGILVKPVLFLTCHPIWLQKQVSPSHFPFANPLDNRPSTSLNNPSQQPRQPAPSSLPLLPCPSLSDLLGAWARATCIDVIRHNQTILDDATSAPHRRLLEWQQWRAFISGSWFGFTRFTVLKKLPPEGRMRAGDRLTKI